MSSRLISYSEISTAISCQAKWDFSYSDVLAGSSLRQKAISPLLSGGKAFGAAAAAFHVHADQLDAGEIAVAAMDEMLEADADRQREHGVYDQQQHSELRLSLLGILLDYFERVEAVVMDPVVERRVLAPIPSRTGQRSSNRYWFEGYVDATETEDGAVWLDEFKLRTRSLTDVQMITNSRQLRWYSWAWQQQVGVPVAGVWFNERLNAVPKPARILQSGKPSHAKDQMSTVQSYLAACREMEVEPNPETVDALKQRRWQQRVRVRFREGELEEAGHELVSAAQLIRDLDSGDRYPLRNVKASNCNWCAFKDICPAPDGELIDALFERMPPKADRDPQYHHERSST